MTEVSSDSVNQIVGQTYSDDKARIAFLEHELHVARERIEALERLDREAAKYVESPICMRTNFTGDPPYVGWEGLGLALNEALDERDRLRSIAAGVLNIAKNLESALVSAGVAQELKSKPIRTKEQK